VKAARGIGPYFCPRKIELEFNMSLPPLDFTGSASFEPNSGGAGSDLVTHDGHYAVKIVKAEAGLSKAGNAQVAFECIIEDDDEKGKRVKSWVPYAGTDKKGRPNAQRFFQVLTSAGTEKDKLLGLDGKQMPIEDVCKSLEGKVAYVEIATEKSYDGMYWNSNIRFWNTKQRYEDQKAVGAHRRPIAAECVAWQQGRGSGGANGATAAAATAAPAAPSNLL